ncbi:hypothetical protein GH714_016358 [Hevea brasiliensis]|uniref:protein-serine/threonine phosphatase n=1 Tax=Hevea brasiliensis TaxID=3981 RepID=A0A6A6LXX4_HEVBR|nr:hypothetical protein GH714_016358 [Hevea brasiliensis]
MLSRLMNFLRACWQPSSERYAHTGSDAAGRQDGLLWYKDTGQHLSGEFSMAVVQANNLLEDQSQLESGPLSSLESGPYGTFVGIYDGHGGPETSRYINDHLFQYLKRFTSEHQSMSVDVIRKAYQATEEGFLSLVTKQWPMKPQIAAVGSCCLVGVICGGTLYIANLGDSRAVLGKLVKATEEVLAIQLSSEHNVAIESVRQEMHSMHPDDSQIVVLKHNVWRVKGLIQVSRSIGDVYLKKAEFNREPLYVKFRLREPFKRPILSSEPSISVHELQSHDQFLIFASDGLWEHLSNQDAVDIVQNHPRNGIARRLVKAALQEAAKKREMRYSDLKKIDRGVRRHFHDDITVIVVFLDANLVSRASSVKGPSISVRDDEDDVVSLCRERKRLLKLAVERRYAFADAQFKYNQSIYAVAMALRLFVARHSSPSSPFLITFPSTTSANVDTKETFLTNSMFLQQSPTEPTNETIACQPSDSKVSLASSKLETKVQENQEANNDNGDHEEQESGEEEDESESEEGEGLCEHFSGEDGPPLPSPQREIGWDFFYPFDEMRSDVFNGFSQSSEEDLRAVREKEGIPELEEDGEKVANENETANVNCDVGHKEMEL